MSNTSEQVAQMVDMLPDSEQLFALEFVKRLILAWDPDFSRATAEEASTMENGIESLRRGEGVRHEDINWN